MRAMEDVPAAHSRKENGAPEERPKMSHEGAGFGDFAGTAATAFFTGYFAETGHTRSNAPTNSAPNRRSALLVSGRNSEATRGDGSRAPLAQESWPGAPISRFKLLAALAPAPRLER